MTEIQLEKKKKKKKFGFFLKETVEVKLKEAREIVETPKRRDSFISVGSSEKKKIEIEKRICGI